MSTTTSQQLVENYLRRLRKASRELPREERGELRAQIGEHLRDALPDGASEATTRTALERLGDPTALVAEHLDRLGVPARRVGTQEWAAIILLLIGGFILVAGWFVGVVLLWSSRAWSTREKLIGTLLVPGGLAVGVYAGLVAGGGECFTFSRLGHATITSCTPRPSTLHEVLISLLLVALIIAPIGTAIFLVRRARRPPA
jgi:hypothetical protein